ncbi:MAG: type IV secretion system protein [Actinomycetales bacterium]|nr:type IV secretion system protein [Actinomycetales bacterium]
MIITALSIGGQVKTDWIGDASASMSQWVSETFITPIVGVMAGLINDGFDYAFVGTGTTDAMWTAVEKSNNGQLGTLDTWVLIMAPIIIVLMTIQVVVALVRKNPAGLARAVVGGLLGIPGSYFAVWVIKQVSAVIDQITAYIISTLGPEGGKEPMMQIFGLTPKAGGGWSQTLGASWVIPPTAQVIVALIITLVAFIFVAILMFAMILRTLAIVVLASVAPLVIMTQPLEWTSSWFPRWAEMLVGLLLAKPLAASVFVLTIRITSGASDFVTFTSGLVGLIICIAMPFIAMNMFSFTPSGGGSMSNMESGVRGGGSSLARGAHSSVSSVRSLASKVVKR